MFSQLPWFETPIDYDVRAKPRSIASLTGTKDLQMVNITCRVLSRPSVENLPTIYRELGTDYDERVLPSIVNGEFLMRKKKPPSSSEDLNTCR